MDADDRVLLIDLENSVGPLPKRNHNGVLRRVGAIRAAAGRLHHCVAAFGMATGRDRTLVTLLSQTGVAPLPVTPGKNAADYALLEHAQEVHRQGGRTFVVASADHRLSAVAKLGRLEVIAWEHQEISKRLEAAAQVVWRIPRPTGAVASRGRR